MASAHRVSSERGFSYDVYLSGGPDLVDLLRELTVALERNGLTVAQGDALQSGGVWGSDLDSLLQESQFLYVPVINAESARNRSQQSEIRSFLNAVSTIRIRRAPSFR